MKPTYDTLYDLYVNQGLSSQRIADQLGWSAAYIHKRLRELGIPTRKPGHNAEPANKPTKDELYDLYVNQRLTQRQIAEIYGVKHISVRRWLQRCGIASRPSRGLANRGIEGPTADELYRMVHLEHKSYAEIASLYGVDYTAVPHWLTKHGIRKPTVWDTRTNGRWVKFDRETLENLYLNEHLSTLQIASKYGVTSTAVRNWMIHYGIERRPDGWDGKRFECKDGHLVKSTYERKVCDWLSDRGIAHQYEPDLPFDRRYKSDFLANGWYVEIWGVKNDATYDKRRKNKVRLYKEHGLPLIQIRPDCFAAKNKDRWARKLQKILTVPDCASPAQTSLLKPENLAS